MGAARPLAAGGPGPGSPFGTASVTFAALTVIVPVLLIAYFGAKADNETSDPTRPLAPLGLLLVGGALSVFAAGISGLLGTVAGGLALARGERKSWLAAVGLSVNGPVALFVLYLLVVVRSNTGG